MTKIFFPVIRPIVLLLSVIIFCSNVNGQTSMPEELTKGSINDQLNYLEQRTRIYEFYRAIREDMFQKFKNNVSDTLTDANNQIIMLNKETLSLNHKIDSLNGTLESTKLNLSDMTRTKNSIKVIGMEVNKTFYNSIMGIVISGLLLVLVIGFIAFKRNISVTAERKRELDELKKEFEAYKKTTREAREKMSMAHFNELKRLRGEK